jgi:hypothetical protein
MFYNFLCFHQSHVDSQLSIFKITTFCIKIHNFDALLWPVSRMYTSSSCLDTEKYVLFITILFYSFLIMLFMFNLCTYEIKFYNEQKRCFWTLLFTSEIPEDFLNGIWAGDCNLWFPDRLADNVANDAIINGRF